MSLIDDLNDPRTVIIIGRGHSGTRAISHTLHEAGFFMGVEGRPFEPGRSADFWGEGFMYKAAKTYGKHVRLCTKSPHEWPSWRWPDADKMAEKIRPLLEKYLEPFRDKPGRLGWKLPETVLAYPAIIRLLPHARYIWWVRDVRDNIADSHVTDDLQKDWRVPCPGFNHRAESAFYQWNIVHHHPKPARWLRVRFEDFVLQQESTVQMLSAFVGADLPMIPVKTGRAFVCKDEPFDPPYLRRVARMSGYDV